MERQSKATPRRQPKPALCVESLRHDVFMHDLLYFPSATSHGIANYHKDYTYNRIVGVIDMKWAFGYSYMAFCVRSPYNACFTDSTIATYSTVPGVVHQKTQNTWPFFSHSLAKYIQL
jgi:hypothetical protein